MSRLGALAESPDAVSRLFKLAGDRAVVARRLIISSRKVSVRLGGHGGRSGSELLDVARPEKGPACDLVMRRGARSRSAADYRG